MNEEETRVRMKMIFKDAGTSVQTGIQCLNCGMTSWNPNDVSQHYCGNCHLFGDLVPTWVVFDASA